MPNFKVRYRDEEIEISAVAIKIEEAVKRAFAITQWNGGKPPEGWNFRIEKPNKRIYTNIPRNDWVDDEDIIVVQIPRQERVSYPGC